jgi:hypothetical protein
VGELRELFVPELELGPEGLELGRIDETPLLGVLDQRSACEGLQQLVHGVLTQGFSVVLSSKPEQVDLAAQAAFGLYEAFPRLSSKFLDS